MFSVVIPVYKNYLDLMRAVESCLHPLIKEIIIIDDTPSKEQTAMNLPKVESVDITIVRNKKNRGVTFSRNRGYLMCTQPYIIFLDSDDTLIASSLPSAHNYLVKKSLDCAFFNTSTNGIANSELINSVEGGSDLLLKMANSGERLVIVRKRKGKPFIGFLRGHELAGLFRFALKSDLKLGWCPLILREYNHTNENSLSQMRLSKERSFLIYQGHKFIAYKLFLLKEYKLSLTYYLKGAYYAVTSLFSS